MAREQHQPDSAVRLYATPVTASRRSNRGPSAGPENRRAIIAAAREIFHEGGVQAPLSAVARRAGVGQGSLYRHFPDRMSLAIAVFDENLRELEDLAMRDESTMDDLFDAITEQAIGSTALVDLVLSSRDDPRAETLGLRMQDVIATIASRDQRDGRMAPDVDPADVMLAVSMLALMLSKSAPEERAATAARGREIYHRAFALHPTAHR